MLRSGSKNRVSKHGTAGTEGAIRPSFETRSALLRMRSVSAAPTGTGGYSPFLSR
jgi:hypothetical protein